jgi:hypothetical protein
VSPHLIRLVIGEDLRRTRLTVVFRLLLAIPHRIWLVLWSIAAFFAGIASWFATLVQGRSPEALHRFLSAYLRYEIHVFAYRLLVADPFPGFAGRAGSYPIDLEVDPPAPQEPLGHGLPGLYLLTDRYAHSSPPVAEPPTAEELRAAA